MSTTRPTSVVFPIWLFVFVALVPALAWTDVTLDSETGVRVEIDYTPVLTVDSTVALAGSAYLFPSPNLSLFLDGEARVGRDGLPDRVFADANVATDASLRLGRFTGLISIHGFALADSAEPDAIFEVGPSLSLSWGDPVFVLSLDQDITWCSTRPSPAYCGSLSATAAPAPRLITVARAGLCADFGDPATLGVHDGTQVQMLFGPRWLIDLEMSHWAPLLLATRQHEFTLAASATWAAGRALRLSMGLDDSTLAFNTTDGLTDLVVCPSLGFDLNVSDRSFITVTGTGTVPLDDSSTLPACRISLRCTFMAH